MFSDFHVKQGPKFHFDKRLFEIGEVEITRVDCIVYQRVEKNMIYLQITNTCSVRIHHENLPL